jgi:hypothetical protein
MDDWYNSLFSFPLGTEHLDGMGLRGGIQEREMRRM